MKKLLIGGIVLFLTCRSFCQVVSISCDKIVPLNLLGEYIKIRDTSGEFIKSTYQMNQRFWKIHFTNIQFDKNFDILRLSGAATIFADKTDSLKINNFDVYLGLLKNDTLINIKHLNLADFVNDGGNFKVHFDLKEYSVIIFSSPNRLPRIFDFSFLLHRNGSVSK